MHINTRAAVRSLATEHELKVLIMSSDEVSVQEDYYGSTHTVKRVEGGWILAHYSNYHSQWQSSDVKNAEAGFRYAFSHTPQGLANYGVTIYKTVTMALRKAIDG